MIVTRPNILIFMAGHWRGDWTGAAGHTAVRTPHLDRLSQAGIYFNRAFATNPMSTPSQVGFATGWYPHTRGHRADDSLLDAGDPHLLRYLSEAGYHIAWGGENHLLTDRAVAESVDTRFGPSSKSNWHNKSAAPADDPGTPLPEVGPTASPLETHPDVQMIRQAQAFIRNPPAAPYCLWVNVGAAGSAYRVPEPYYSMYRPEHIPPPIEADYAGLAGYLPLLRAARGGERLDLRYVANIRAAYAGMVTMTDHLLGEVLQTLDDTSAASDCAVIATAAHGDYAGDYGLPGTWLTGCQDALLRVPLAMRIPGGARVGSTDALVQHLDVLPTLLQLAGVAPRTTQFGHSLLPILTGARRGIRDAVFADSGANVGRDLSPIEPVPTLAANHADAASRTMMARTDRWKYVWRQIGREELYDLHTDPHETRNLLTYPRPDVEAVRVQMQALMVRWCAETGDVLPTW